MSISSPWNEPSDIKPRPFTPVIAHVDTDHDRTVKVLAIWASDKMLEQHEDWQDEGCYEEETDTYWSPEGWYEYNYFSDDRAYPPIAGRITHWIHLPYLPIQEGGE